MAEGVKIPVVIDIEGAFNAAAKSVKTAMDPLRDAIESAPLSLFIDVKIPNKGKKVLIELFDDARTSTEEFQIALNQVIQKIDKIALKGGFNLGKGLSEDERNLLEAATLLERKLTGVGDEASAMTRVFSINMKRAEADLQKYASQLDKLTIKQNRLKKFDANGLVSTKQSSQYKRVSTEIDGMNLKIAQTRQFLAACSVELDKITHGSKNAGVAMSVLPSEAVKMAEGFRQGSVYLAQWNAALGTANNRMGMLLKSAASLFALHAATSFVRNVREVTSEFEMQRVALGGIIQDTEMAGKLFKRIKAAAIQSPFEIKDLVSFTKQLSAYRIETENLFDVTMRLADISAGLGVDMSRLVLAYGQVRAASVLRGQELRQFTEAGIPLVELLAKKFEKLGRVGTTTADVFELISKRAVPFRMIEEIFNDMTSAGGIFYKMQEKQSETLKGQWMKLKDALSIMYDEIGNTRVVHGAMETLMKDAMKLMQNWKEASKYIGIAVTALTAYKIALINARIAENALTAAQVSEISALQLNVVQRNRVIASLFGETAATKVQVAMGNLYVAVKRRELAATNLFTASLYRMTAALLANPYAIALAGIAALVAILIKFTIKSKEAKITVDAFQKSIASFDKAKTHANDISNLCDVYDELSKKATRTKDEEEKLARVTKDLAKAYPSAVSGAENHTRAITLDTTAIRERNDAVKEAIKLSLLQDKAMAEAEISNLQAEYNQISETLKRGTVIKGAFGGTWEEVLTEEQKARLGSRLIELEQLLGDFREASNEAEESIKEFSAELIGPEVPKFFGDAWRMQISQYTVMLDEAAGKTQVFGDDQIKQFKSVKDACDEAAKGYKEQAKLVEFYAKALEKATGKQKEQLLSLKTNAEAMKNIYGQVLTDYNAWNLVEEKKPRGGDKRLSNLNKRISEIKNAYNKYNELLKYVSKENALLNIDEMFPTLEGWQPTYENMLGKLEKELKDVEESRKKKPYDPVLLDMERVLRKEIAQVKFDKIKKDIEEQLQKLSNEIKRSEAAQNFYRNILGTTGDTELSRTLTVAVYGNIGEDFEKRIEKELDNAFARIDPSEMDQTAYEELIKARVDKNFDAIRDNIDKIPENVRSMYLKILDEVDKYNSSLQKKFADAIAKSGNAAQRIATIEAKANQDILDLQQAAAQATAKAKTQKEKDAINAALEQSIEMIEGKKRLDIFKASEDYIRYFAELNVMTAEEAAKIQGDFKQQLYDAFRTGAIGADELVRSLRAVDKQFNKITKISTDFTTYLSDGIDGIIKRFEDYATTVEYIGAKIGKGESLTAGETQFADKMLKRFASTYGDDQIKNVKSVSELLEQFPKNKEGLQSAGMAFSQMGQGMSAMAGKGSAALAIVDAIFKAINGAITGIQEFIDELNRTRTEENKVAEGMKYISDINKYVYEGWEKVKAGDVIGSLMNLASAVASVTSNIQEDKVKRFNDEIKDQDRLLKRLTYSYERLTQQEEKLFGADFIESQNQKLAVLQAQREAYLRQAAAEAAKGKSSDSDKVQEYKDLARDIADQISDMYDEIQQKFLGTDLASASRDFASAWIDAYEEFSSTTDAINDKFEEMIKNMVIESMAAKIIERNLSSVFDLVDKLTEDDGQLTVTDAALVASKMKGSIEDINVGMTNLMTQLDAVGINFRSMGSGLTGIAKDFQGASEESILGLSAGVNTQNFYMSLIHDDVQTIKSILSGTTTAPNINVSVLPETDPLRNHVSNINVNLAELLRKVNSVITSGSSSTNTAFIAVK